MYIGEKPLYIKHLSHKEHIGLDDIERACIERARERGLPDEKTQLEYLKREGLWTQKDESEIVQQEIYIRQMNDGKKHIILPSVLEVHLRQLKEGEAKLVQLLTRKRQLLGETCETYAAKIVNEYYILKSVFKDRDLKEAFFSEEEFDDIEDEELNDITIKYNDILDICSDQNIKKLAIQDFFMNYYYLCEDNIYSFFGKPIVDFTYFQVRLANQAKYFKHLFSNNDINTVPPEIRADPDKLIAYFDTTKKGKEMMNKHNGDAVGMVGATKEDLKALGVQNQTQNPTEGLKDILKFFPSNGR